MLSSSVNTSRPLGSVRYRQFSGEPVACAATEVNEAVRNSGGIFLKWGSEAVSPFSPPWGTGGTKCPVTALLLPSKQPAPVGYFPPLGG